MHKQPGKDTLRGIIDRLAEAYGAQDWWPAEDRFEIIVGAILTQRVSWTNVEQAMLRLREAGCLSVLTMLATPRDVLSELIRPALFHNVKADRLLAFCRFVERRHGPLLGVDALLELPAADLREALLGVAGIGPETADAIVLYAAGKATFVVDAYARRILTRLGWIEQATPDEVVRDRAMADLSRNAPLLGEAHALLVEHGKRRCLKRNPRCPECVLAPSCAFLLSSNRAEVR
ncbi:hypothetical protein JW848_08480 [Candidatus Bipolaricaulota bacterium]|nr:hypothetical protein [Candidatus Bipolaricaulota bacterium]